MLMTFVLLCNKWTQAQLIWRRGCSDWLECSTTVSGFQKPCILTLRLRSLLCIIDKKKLLERKIALFPDLTIGGAQLT